MKKLITSVIVLLSVLLFTLSSCEKESTRLDKEELYEIYTTKPDAFLNAMARDIDSVIASTFSPREREELLIARIENLNAQGGASELAFQFFNGFRQAHSKSFFEAAPEEQEGFCSRFLLELRSSEYGECLWPDLGCTSLPDNGCFARPSEFAYVQRKGHLPPSNIIDHNCRRSEGSTDCDNSYYWEAGQSVYNNPQGFDFYWYCDRVVYRAIMDDMVGGFRDVQPFRFGTFLGNRHEIAMAIAWPASACRQDRWVESTRFYVLVRMAPVPKN